MGIAGPFLAAVTKDSVGTRVVVVVLFWITAD